jgi:flagellar hook assembly protein FlgD
LHATSLRIYNLNGRLVNVVFQGELETGTHEFQWNGTNYSSGVYFIKMQSGDFIKTRKMILLK